MAERKVLNKYYPPDFDPTKLRRFEKKTARKMCNVRMMLPMSVRCYTCGNYLYIGTKFNMKVETVKDEDYLGIKVHRFYFKCTQCYAEITFKTDPKNHDYVAEWGASRNHEAWKDMLMAEEEYKELKKQEMKEDAMKSLEHRTYDSKREMDILDALDQVKALNRRQATINYDELIQKAVKEKDIEQQKELQDLEDKEVKEKFLNKNKVKRIEDYYTPEENEKNQNNTDLPLLGNKIKRNVDSIDSDCSEDEKKEIKTVFNNIKINVKKTDNKNIKPINKMQSTVKISKNSSSLLKNNYF